ncbi:MAG: hypothetical protein ABR543_16940 [Gemmatimonadaceae bacterium]
MNEIRLQTSNLALVALRASFPPQHVSGCYMINGGDRLAFHEAAEVISHLPRPLTCNATLEQGVIHINWRALTMSELDAHRQQIEHWSNSKTRWDFLGAGQGLDVTELSVYCLGADQYVLATINEIVTWEEEFFLLPISYVMDRPEHFRGRNAERVLQAQQLGAVGFIEFLPPQSPESLRAAVRNILNDLRTAPAPDRAKILDMLQQHMPADTRRLLEAEIASDLGSQ